ncbi:MAG: hypothetical protein J6D36_00525 [Erysipelotrichaceae bacterium]|nr:hypothetical protein [Erysipelotrichaceae bacterium]
MKKIIAAILAVFTVLSFNLSGVVPMIGSSLVYAREDKNGFDENTNEIITFGGMAIQIPTYFEKGDNSSDDTLYYYAETGESVVMLMLAEEKAPSSIQKDFGKYKEQIKDDFISGMGADVSVQDEIDLTIAGYEAYGILATGEIEDMSVTFEVIFVYNADTKQIVCFCLGESDNAVYEYDGDFEKICKTSESLSDTADTKDTKTNKDDSKKESKKSSDKSGKAKWEVGKANVASWQDSIDSIWVQIIVPVENTGEGNLYLEDATMDLENKDGELVDSVTYVSAYPQIVKPGETAYYYEETILDTDELEDLTVVPHINVKEATVDCVRYKTSDVKVKDKSYGGISVTGRVENNSEKDSDFTNVVILMYNKKGQMIASCYTILSDTLKSGEKIGFSMNSVAIPKDITAKDVDHYDIYAYPSQYQFD